MSEAVLPRRTPAGGMASPRGAQSAIALIRADRTLLWSYLLHVGASPRASGLTDEREAARYLLWFALEGWRQHQQVTFSPDLLAWLSEPAGPCATRLAAHVLMRRADLRERMRRKDGGIDFDAFHAWYYSAGVDEMGLGPFISARERLRLHAPARADEPDGPTWLAALSARERSPLLPPWLRTAPMPAAAHGPPLAVNLFGFADGVLGVGEDVRTMAAALLRAGAHVAIHNVAIPDHVGASAPQGWATLFTDRPLFGTSLFCLPPFEMARLQVRHGEALFAGRRNIGVWPWELPTLPADWRGVFDAVDEVWAISRYLAAAFGALTDKPVRHAPPHVEDAAPDSAGVAEIRAGAAFLAIAMCDFNSFTARKNPEGAIAAFLAAFPDPSGAERLVVKTLNGHAHPEALARLNAAAGGDPRVVVRDAALPRAETLGLIAASDCLLSLHRAEGFGRVPAEAMRLGVPVVATGWSGSSDLLDESTGWPVPYRLRPVERGEYAYAEGSHWAEPHVGAAARALRAIRHDSTGEAARRAAAARQRVEALCGREACARRLRALLGRGLRESAAHGGLTGAAGD